jgi:hypothetical protein
MRHLVQSKPHASIDNIGRIAGALDVEAWALLRDDK